MADELIISKRVTEGQTMCESGFRLSISSSSTSTCGRRDMSITLTADAQSSKYTDELLLEHDAAINKNRRGTARLKTDESLDAIRKLLSDKVRALLRERT